MDDDELQALRRVLAGLERGRGKWYPDELRGRIVDWTRRQIGRGVSEAACAHALGLQRRTLGQWLEHGDGRAHRRGRPVADHQVALVPVEIVEAPAPSASITLVAPSGYRLEGLTLADAITALARLR